MQKLSETLRDALDSADAVVRSGFAIVPEEVVRGRLESCGTCAHARGSGMLLRCSVCGCAMRLKVRFAATECALPPEDRRWSRHGPAVD